MLKENRVPQLAGVVFAVLQEIFHSHLIFVYCCSFEFVLDGCLASSWNVTFVQNGKKQSLKSDI